MGRFTRVAVTGGAGFIGSCLVRELLNRGYSVLVLDNFSSGCWENLRGLLGRDGLDVVEGDIRDRRVLRKVLKYVDAVVHLAALIDVEASVQNPYETHDVNVSGTLSVLMESVTAGVKRFVFISSTAVYGETNPLPLRENYSLHPISPYAASKAAAEAYCLAFSRCYGIEAVILRYFNVYGPGQRNSVYSGVITKFLKNALNGMPLIVYGNGEQTRDFIYIDDVVSATVLALEKEGLTDEVFNICTGKQFSVNKLLDFIRDILGDNIQVVYDKPKKGDIAKNYGDTLKAEKMLGFKAKIDFKDGLKKMVNSFR
ncbi:MAG: NAD-dependent epimerase/dehydratase family protein [Candidatus Bathyarchaeia archaeon]